MKRPTWATIVGVLGIIFSCFGILGAGYDIMMPKMMEFQKEMFSRFEEIQQKAVEKQSSGQKDDEEFQEISKFFQGMWQVPGWFGIWSVTIGIIKLILSGLLLFTCIYLLQVKPFSIKLFYWTAALNIGVVVLKGIVSIASMSFVGMAMMGGAFFGLVVNIVLIIVVALGNKDASFKHTIPAVST